MQEKTVEPITIEEHLILAGYLLTREFRTEENPHPVLHVADVTTVCNLFSEAQYGQSPFMCEGHLYQRQIINTNIIMAIERIPSDETRRTRHVRMTAVGMKHGRALAQRFKLTIGEFSTPPAKHVRTSKDRTPSEAHRLGRSAKTLCEAILHLELLHMGERYALLTVMLHTAVQKPMEYVDLIDLERVLQKSIDSLQIGSNSTRAEKLRDLFERAHTKTKDLRSEAEHLLQSLIRSARSNKHLFPHE